VAPVEEAVANVSRIKAPLVLFSDVRGLFLALCEVRADFRLMTQVVPDDRVHIRQRQ
jgi:hypothetical protein